MIKHPPCHHLCERLGSVTSRWCVVAITLMTSLLAFTNSHLRAYIQYSDVKSTGYVSADLEFSHVTTVPEYRTISFVKSMKLQSCPLDYFKNLSRGQYTQSLRAPHSQVNMSNHDNYSTQTHLSQAALLSNHSFVKKYLNLDIPKVFNASFVNPCWYDTDMGENGALRCLPYFFLAGFPKSGTTDLFYKMGIHPQILAGCKEPHWWTRRRFQIASDERRLDKYVRRFKDAASCMEHMLNLDLPGPVRLITADGSASTIWDSRVWRRFPANSGADEPQELIADHIRHYLPRSKIILIVRDPIERIFSDYGFFWEETGTPSPEDFHNKVVNAISAVNECIQKNPLRTCVYSPPAHIKLRLTISMYSVYVNDWLRIFPRQQLHVLRTEDYARSPQQELTKIFNFLQLDPLHSSVYDKIKKIPKTNTSKKPKITMLPETREMLSEFYSPYNNELAVLLNSTDYMWQDGGS